MLSISILLVLSSGLAHAVWNLFTKKSENKMAFLWLITLPTTVILLPILIWELMHVQLTWSLVLFLFMSFFFQGCYTLLVSKAYTYGDISQVYPIMRGTGTLLIPFFSAIFFQEYLSVPGWLGVICIVIGVFAISGVIGTDRQAQPVNPLALRYAFAVGLCITGYTLTDKQIVQQLSPFALLEITNFACLIVAGGFVWKKGLIRSEWQKNWRTIVLGAVLSPGSYLLFLFAMTLAPLAAIAPIREVSTVFGTLLGVFLLKERQRVWRLSMSLMITIGIISIAVWG
ncbi:EamA domain-containing protein [Brevibacillus sp. IT-7CA2]|uniref:DMT family transporter n=1 Tax=Brevibacillus sp. IT-7CA2 TaxID=3026436 RepID=UPI0039E01981